MAKLSSINKNEKRKALVKKYAAKYAKLKAIADDESLDDGERLIARLKMAEQNGLWLDAYRTETLDDFYALAGRAKVTEAA